MKHIDCLLNDYENGELDARDLLDAVYMDPDLTTEMYNELVEMLDENFLCEGEGETATGLDEEAPGTATWLGEYDGLGEDSDNGRERGRRIPSEYPPH